MDLCKNVEFLASSKCALLGGSPPKVSGLSIDSVCARINWWDWLERYFGLLGGSSPGHYLARLAIAGLDYQMVDPGGYGSEKVLGGALPPLLRSLELVCRCIRT